MAKTKFELEADIRTDIGKGASRRLRHTNKVPAVVYGGGEKSVTLTLDHNKTLHALSQEAVYSHILNLKVGKNTEKVILKDIQRDPAKPRIAHIDFLRVRADQKLQMHVPLHFTGEEEAPGLNQGGVLSHLMSDVEITCLPANLPEFLSVDVSGMTLDQTLHLSDLKLPEGVELVAFLHDAEAHDHPVVSLHIPRVAEEEVVPTGAEDAGTEETAAEATAENTEKGEEK